MCSFMLSFRGERGFFPTNRKSNFLTITHFIPGICQAILILQKKKKSNYCMLFFYASIARGEIMPLKCSYLCVGVCKCPALCAYVTPLCICVHFLRAGPRLPFQLRSHQGRCRASQRPVILRWWHVGLASQVRQRRSASAPIWPKVRL